MGKQKRGEGIGGGWGWRRGQNLSISTEARRLSWLKKKDPNNSRGNLPRGAGNYAVGTITKGRCGLGGGEVSDWCKEGTVYEGTGGAVRAFDTAVNKRRWWIEACSIIGLTEKNRPTSARQRVLKYKKKTWGPICP